MFSSLKIFVFFLLVIIALAGFLLFVFFAEDKSFTDAAEALEGHEASISEQATDRSAPKPASLVTEAEAAADLPEFSVIIDFPVTGARVDGDSLVYFDGWHSQLVTANLLGAEYESVPCPQLTNLFWSDDLSRLVWREEEGDFYYYDRVDREPVSLGENISSPVFDQSGKLWYRFVDPEGEESGIRVGSPSNGLVDAKKVLPATSDFVIKNIPGDDKVSLYLEPSSVRPTNLQSLDADGNKNTIIGKGEGLEVSWSPSGDRLLFTRLNDYGRVELWQADNEGDNLGEQGLATMIDKLVWSHDDHSVILAVPRVMPLYSDYQTGKIFTEDRLFQLDLDNGDIAELYDFTGLSEKIDARHMFLSREEKILYFINEYNHSLYAVNISKLKTN